MITLMATQLRLLVPEHVEPVSEPLNQSKQIYPQNLGLRHHAYFLESAWHVGASWVCDHCSNLAASRPYLLAVWPWKLHKTEL